MFAGSARRVINCEIGDDIAGQMHRRICERVRDDLEANVLYLADDHMALVLVSLDLIGLFGTAIMREIRAELGAAAGVPERNVILACTHTHEGPDMKGGLLDSVRNDAYVARLREALKDGVAEAAAVARPARVGWAQGSAHIGYNRRLCWADGSHTMYGDAKRPDFTGLEGPDDPTHTVLFAVDENDRHIAVMHANCCHATCMESATFASADFPGEARRLLRDALGNELPVLYLQGASGDVSPWNMLGEVPRWDGELRVKEVGALLAAETLKLMHEARLVADPVLRHDWEDLRVAVRLPSPEALARAREIAEAGEEKAGRWDYALSTAGVLPLQEQFAASPVDTLALHAVRIGGYAVLTNPCELYCQFGLDMRRRSPAEVTAIAQLADGLVGYCPTIPALMGGGYSGEAIQWCRLEAYAGYKIVEASARLVRGLWEG
jgi:hypothetical protein